MSEKRKNQQNARKIAHILFHIWEKILMKFTAVKRWKMIL